MQHGFCIVTNIEIVLANGASITLSAVVVVVFIFQVPVFDHGAQIGRWVVDVVFPSMVMPEWDGGQVGILEVALTSIDSSNIS